MILIKEFYIKWKKAVKYTSREAAEVIPIHTNSPKIIYLFLFSLLFLILMTFLYYHESHDKATDIFICYALLMYSCTLTLYLMYYLLFVFSDHAYYQQCEFPYINMLLKSYGMRGMGFFCGKRQVFYITMFSFAQFFVHFNRYCLLDRQNYTEWDIKNLLFMSWLFFWGFMLFVGVGTLWWLSLFGIIVAWIIMDDD